LEAALESRGARIAVIDEHDSMPNKDIVFDGDAFADKGVAGDLAGFSDSSVLLDLDKCADLCLVSDLTSIEIDELREPYILPQFHVVRNAVMGAHR
jgi:hypothetical protein